MVLSAGKDSHVKYGRNFYRYPLPANWLCKLAFILLFCQVSFGQTPSLELGLRFQKTLDLYFENGLTIQYAHPRLLKNRLRVGAGYVSSRLGSAMASNAIKQDNAFFSGIYLFRPEKALQPFLTANLGWFAADYGSDLFDNLPHSSLIASLEAGFSVKVRGPFRIGGAFGYNLITGDGAKGPGTLFPVYAQLNLTINVLKNHLK